MEVMLPTALGGVAALVGAVTYGLRQPAGRRGGAGSRGRWFAPRPTSGLVDLATFTPADAEAGLRRASLIASRAGKRAMDIVLAATLLLVTAPILVVVAIAVPLESAGPVFYRQTRVGRGGRTFEIVKFRSMRQDAEKGGVRWASVNDDRVTRVGRILRKLRLDEIPQAFNVLAGEMSFVGPRPERPEFVEILRGAVPNYDLRHEVKPGITGWAQVKCAYGASIDDAKEKHRYDLYYLKNIGLLMDLKIVFMTVRVALFGIGAR